MPTATQIVPKERPLILSGESVVATREGRKTMTRCVMNPQPSPCGSHAKWVVLPDVFHNNAFKGTPAEGKGHAGEQRQVWYSEDYIQNLIGEYGPCPYGAVGDKLWVRETWGLVNERDKPWSVRNGILYRATDERPYHLFRWRSPLLMPRWASRLTLEITDIRIERLQDISESDACAEGHGSPVTRDCKVPKFQGQWVADHCADGWSKNPSVWVISFRRLDLVQK